MSVQVLSESTPTARKSHNCDACDFILNGGISGFGYSFAELRLIAKAKKNNFNIVKGQKYINQNNKCMGDIYTFKAIPEMHELCLKYELYDE